MGPFFMAQNNLGMNGSRVLGLFAACSLLWTPACHTGEPQRKPSQESAHAERDAESDPEPSADPDGGMTASLDAQLPDPNPHEDAPGVPVTFAPSDELLLNPERGFYTTTRLTNPGDLAYVREEGKSLVYAAVHLQDYLHEDHAQDLPQQLLDDVRAGFAAAASRGLPSCPRLRFSAAIRSMTLSPRGSAGASGWIPSPFNLASITSRRRAS